MTHPYTTEFVEALLKNLQAQKPQNVQNLLALLGCKDTKKASDLLLEITIETQFEDLPPTTEHA